MKKLLVTAIGAAVAFGAFADAVRFESSEAGTVTALSQLPGGTSLWSEPEGATNTYAIGAAGTVSAPLSIASSGAQPTQALDIKTTFGKPLSLNAVSGGAATNINDGLYFDSLVKFTVCEDAPADTYTGAKIIMWLQEKQDASGNATGTNLIVRAGYLSGGDTVAATPTNYVCTLPNGFNADAWHRVTIKAIADITTTGRGVPGFAIYLDQNGDTATSDINAGTADMWDDSFPASELTEAASLLNDSRALFPSLDVTSGNKATLTSASFDGTGSITDLIFTDNGPDFAKDMVSQKASVTINGNEQTGIVTLADAINAANGAAEDAAVVITLAKGFDFGAPVTIKPTNTGVAVVLDFNGFVIENTGSECLITNTAVLTVTNSSVGATGGIVGKAIYQGEGAELTIAGGNFWGDIEAFDDLSSFTISGGAFNQNAGDLELLGVQVAEGKKISDTKNEDNLYPVVEDRDPVWADYLGEAVDGAYEIDNLAELKAFQANVGTLATADVTFKLTADIALEEAWEGIGVKGGKDLVNGNGKNIPAYEAGAFSGTFDGQNHTISNFQMEDGTDYGGFFNSVNGATISNLKITYKEDKLCANSSSTGDDTGATFVGVARNSTLQNLTALAGTVTTVSASKDMAGIVAYLMPGSTVDSCTNEINVASLLTAKARKSGGIALITQEGDGTATIRNCKNSGTVTLANAGGQAGGIVGYVGASTTIVDCENTAAVKMVTHMSGTLTMSGVNKGNATVASCNKAIDGLNFATVDGNVATFVADNALAAGNTYKVMNAATATYQFTTVGTIAFDTTIAAPSSYAITAASGLAPDSTTSGNVVTYYATDWATAPAEHPWYEAPAAVVLAQDLPHQGSKTGDAFVSAFHGQGEGEYLGLTYSTSPLQFDLYRVDGTNALTTLRQIPVGETGAGFRGVAISKTLGIAMTLAYATSTTMYAYPLAGGEPTAVSKPDTHAFDSAAFSPDGKYLFSNAIAGEGTDSPAVLKWSVSMENGAVTLTRIGRIDASGRNRNIAYARINGRDLVFSLAETAKVDVIDMTGDDPTAWTSATLVSGLPGKISYGSLCVSGVKVTGGTPHLTVATSANNGATKADVLNVYELTVPATGAVTVSLTKSFDEDALTAAGFGDISDANRYGNTVYVTEDEATIYFARPDNKLYAAQYAAPAPVTPEIVPGSAVIEVTVKAESSTAAIEAVVVTPPTESGADAAAYKALFNITATPTENAGEYLVTLDSIKDEVKEDVIADAVAVLDESGDTKVAVPAGLYYQIIPSTALPISGTAAAGLSDGTGVSVTKPGTTQGFFQIKLSPTPFVGE